MSDISYPLPCINCASRLQSEYACNNCIHNGAKSDDKFDNFISLKDVAPSVNEKSVNDNVNHPSHYTTGKYECIDVMIEIFGIEAVKTFCLLNAFKYNYRSGRKNGRQDIEKAVWYSNKYLELSK
jgi:hypothetical protein|nr:MAG TPA: nucelotide kinase [Bacteriophage sp.]